MHTPTTSLLLMLTACSTGGEDVGTEATEAGLPCEPSPPDAAAPVIDLDGEHPWNVLVISIDTLRVDHTDSPFLTELAAESVVLQDFRSCSNWTYASMLCYFSGRTNVALGFVPIPGLLQEPGEPIDLAPMWFANAGYATRLVSASPYVSEETLLGQGFDSAEQLTRRPAASVSANALSALDDLERHQPDDPWYLHVHYTDPHDPYTAPESYLDGLEGLDPIEWDLSDAAQVSDLAEAYEDREPGEQELIRQHLAVQYQAEVAYLDDELARFWTDLQERGALEKTLVLLFSDHGEQFWEHGDFRHAKSLHPGESDAFAAFWWAGAEPQRWMLPTEQQDLLPTLFDALDIVAPEGFTGSVLGLAPPDRYRTSLLASTTRSPTISVDRNQLRLHYTWDGSRQLYDLQSDANEQSDVYGSWNSATSCLWDQLQHEVNAAAPWIDGTEPMHLVR